MPPDDPSGRRSRGRRTAVGSITALDRSPPPVSAARRSAPRLEAQFNVARLGQPRPTKLDTIDAVRFALGRSPTILGDHRPCRIGRRVPAKVDFPEPDLPRSRRFRPRQREVRMVEHQPAGSQGRGVDGLADLGGATAGRKFGIGAPCKRSEGRNRRSSIELRLALLAGWRPAAARLKPREAQDPDPQRDAGGVALRSGSQYRRRAGRGQRRHPLHHLGRPMLAFRACSARWRR